MIHNLRINYGPVRMKGSNQSEEEEEEEEGNSHRTMTHASVVLKRSPAEVRHPEAFRRERFHHIKDYSALAVTKPANNMKRRLWNLISF
jgi:hypothetical protein